jgi:cellulose synthase/poly-beta-1,6-N-acetylglucosamine synthase-like glycosyltransferase
MNWPSISVVIPTLCEEKHIGGLLAALEAQGYAGKLEILVCDGGSTDQTQAEVERFPTVQFLKTERGVSRQRNFGASQANGELLVFMDADDLPNTHFLSRIAKSYRRIPFAVACPWFHPFDGSLFTKAAYLLFNIGFFVGQSTVRTGSGVCIVAKREAFSHCGGFDESMHLGEDIRLIRSLSPRYGLHRHLFVPLGTSARRFEHEGGWRLLAFYAKITPFLLLGFYGLLQKFEYKPIPYKKGKLNS